MKFLLYLFFILLCIFCSIPKLTATTEKKQLFDDFCQAVLKNDLTRVLELVCHHEKEIEAFINQPHTSSYVNSTALHYAAFAGNKRIIEILLAHGADPHKENSIKLDAFKYAQQSNKTTILTEAIKELDIKKSLLIREHPFIESPYLKTEINKNTISSQLLSVIILFAFFLFCVAQTAQSNPT